MQRKESTWKKTGTLPSVRRASSSKRKKSWKAPASRDRQAGGAADEEFGTSDQQHRACDEQQDGFRHHHETGTSVAREVACRNEASTALSEWVLDPDAVNHLAVLQVLGQQDAALLQLRRGDDHAVPP